MNELWVRVQFGLNTAIAWPGDLGQVLVPFGKKNWNVETFWCAKLVIPTLTSYKRGYSKPHFRIKERMRQRGKVTCPRSHR